MYILYYVTADYSQTKQTGFGHNILLLYLPRHYFPGPGLVRRDSLNKTALRFIEILHKWIDGMDTEQKRLLIEDLFATLQASGYENLSEVQSGGLKSLAAMVKRLDKFAPESRGMMQELLTAICGGWLEQLQENTKDKLSAIPQSFSDKILEKF